MARRCWKKAQSQGHRQTFLRLYQEGQGFEKNKDGRIGDRNLYVIPAVATWQNPPLRLVPPQKVVEDAEAAHYA